MKKPVLILIVITLFAYKAYGVDMAACKKKPEEIQGETKKFALITRGKKVQAAFTDIGCALVFRKELCASESVDFDENSYVYDYNTGEEIPFTSAIYVVDSGIQSPQNYGILAFKDKTSAEKFVQAGKGKVLKFYETILLELK